MSETINRMGEDTEGKGPFEFAPDLAKLGSSLPEGWISNLQFTSMTHYYPFAGTMDITGYPEDQHETIKKTNKILLALEQFDKTVNPSAPKLGPVMIYQGLKFLRTKPGQNDYSDTHPTEVTYIRFQRDGIHESVTYVLRSDTFEYFIDSWFDAINSSSRLQNAINWCGEENNDQRLRSHGHMNRITRAPLELPLSFFEMADPGDHYLDGLMSGDFKLIDGICKRLRNQFDKLIGDVTAQADKLATKIDVRDHTLYLVFKANEDFTGLVVSLDKVPPKLPEGGEYSLGDKPIDKEEWEKEGLDVAVIVRKVLKAASWITKLIADCRAELPDHPYAVSTFNKALKERLLASSHFMKEIYRINPKDVRDQVESVANDILSKLNDHGGNIGLDLNNWTVYQYQDGGMPPVPLVADPLNFRRDVYDAYTDGFIDVLYAFLLNTPSPYIRPYSHRVKADANDGIPLGSIRQAKPV